MYHENGRFVPKPADYKSDYRGAVERVYDAPFGVMPRAFHCARWSL
jgi:hypothetical protein